MRLFRWLFKNFDLKEDVRLVIMQCLVDHPTGIQYAALLNKVALHDIFMGKLIKQLCHDGWIDGSPRSDETLYITPRGAAEYYKLQSVRNREIIDHKMRMTSIGISILSLIISIIAIVVKFL